ncbi:MAG: 4Fe-4S dicluster domain-containing protein [Proteobacteria bacterium]|nr:4Fe-4S dicluster domain-containing protein [Pseudomonadota bacterium]
MEKFTGASREIMWNISTEWPMYALLVVSLGIFSFGLFRRIGVWRKGKSDDERFSDLGGRFLFTVKEILLQKKVLGSVFPGIFHLFIFYSFIVLVVATAVIGLEHDFGIPLFHGPLYVFLTVAAEAAGAFILIGVTMALWRRFVSKPETLDTTLADTWPLLLLSFIVVSGFLIEGLRITTIGDQWAFLTPVGNLAALLFRGISEQSGRTAHAWLWWLHAVSVFAWMAAIPYSKFFHLLTSPANTFFSKRKPAGELGRIDLVALMESDEFDEDFSLGIDTAADFTWKQRLDLDACLSCGRCDQVCPAVAANQPLSPRRFIASMKDLVHKSDKDFAETGSDPDSNIEADTKSTLHPEVVGNAFDENFIWYCRTCMACVQTCPAYVEHVDTLVEIRRNEVNMKARMPVDASRLIKKMESLGNPFAPQSDRVDWTKGLQARTIEPGDKCEVLYWTGCLTALDQSKRKIAENLIGLLHKSGIDFGVMGGGEICCGDPARALGEENMFQTMAQEQVEELNSREFKTLLVSCPHCYNVLKNEYPQFGGRFDVVHHSQFLYGMAADGKIDLNSRGRKKVCYHDPCYLGRYQKIYDSPRLLIDAVPDLTVLEMKSRKDKSLCCGGGGGHFWMDLKEGDPINVLRLEQARETGADTIVTSCPYCLHMLEDAVKTKDLVGEIEIKDIVEFSSENR